MAILALTATASAQSDPDLELKIESIPKLIKAGEPYTYTAVIRNLGKGPAINVRVYNHIWENTEITSASPSGGSCETLKQGRGGGVSCRIGDLASQETATIIYTANFIHLDDGQDTLARAPHPVGGWSQRVASLSVDVIGADRNRSNNIAHLQTDVEPRPNGLPLVRLLFPTENGEVVQTTGQRTVTVRIHAYDLDGSIDRVVVKENKYIPFPFVENGAYKFVYMGKKFTAAQLEAYAKANPPPVRLARRTGNDTFEYTISQAELGANQLLVDVFDNQGKQNWIGIAFIVK